MSQRKYRCLVIQLGKLSDVVQTLMSLKAVKQLYPQVEYHLLVQDEFADAALAVSWIDHVHLFPKKEFLASKKQMIPLLARWISPFADGAWDFVVNWSTDAVSSCVTTLIPALIKYGHMRRTDLASQAVDGWTQYRQGVIEQGIEQNIHLTDVLTTQLLTAFQIHIGDPENTGHHVVTSRSFFDSIANFSKSDQGGLALHIDAFESKTSLPVAEWAKLARFLLQKDPAQVIHVLSSSEDSAVEEEFFEDLLSGAFDGTLLERVNFKRKVRDFDRLSQEISSVEWLITADTGLSQLASVVGTRCFFVSLDNSQLYQKGPYGNGHWILKGSASKITSDVLIACLEYAFEPSESLYQRFVRYGIESKIVESILFTSSVRSPDAGGGACYTPIYRSSLDVASWFSKTIGQVARRWYCGWTPSLDQELNRDQFNSQLLKELRELKESLIILMQILDEAIRTSGRLQQKTGRLKSEKLMSVEERKQIQTLGQKLIELESLVERLGEAKPTLKFFYNIMKVMMHNLGGDALGQMSQEAHDNYKQLLDGAKTAFDMVDHSLEMSKPVAVKSRTLSLVK